MIDFGPASTYPLPCYYVLEGNTIVKSDSYKDLGIFVSNNLNFTTHLYRVINTALSLTNFIPCAFPYCNSSTRYKFFCTCVCPLLEYCSQIWSPYTLENIDIIEGVQRSFIHRLPGLSSLSYSDRLIKTNFPNSLELRRLRADLTLLYNILHNNLYISRNMFVLRSNMVLSSVNT